MFSSSKSLSRKYSFLSYLNMSVGLSCLSALISSCTSLPNVPKPEKIVAYNKPGIVLVHAEPTADIAFPKPDWDTDRLRQWFTLVDARLKRGQAASDPESITILVKEMLRNQVQYMRFGTVVEERVSLPPATGTGFILTDDGIVATAAHVVSAEHESNKQRIWKAALRDVTLRHCDRVLKDIENTPQLYKPLSQTISRADLMSICVDGITEQYEKNLEVDKVSMEVSVVLSSANPGSTQKPNVIKSEVKQVGEQLGEDVAILKMSGENFPTVELAEESLPAIGSDAYSLGYPGEITKLFADKGLPEPTLTKGIISSKRPVGDEQVLQANIAISPGNSGGPLFNEAGKVIGIASFVSQDAQGQQVEGSGFFVPTKTLKRLLQESNITPKLGSLTQDYRAAIDLFQRQQFQQSLPVFQKIRDVNPDFPYIQQMISQIQTESPRSTGTRR